MKIYSLTPEQCVNIPVPRVHGVLYVSKTHGVAIHSCPCGCGFEVVTPLQADDQPGWKLSGTDDSVTLSPSVYCKGFAC